MLITWSLHMSSLSRRTNGELFDAGLSEEWVHSLNHEFLSNSNPDLYRLYHLVLPKDFCLQAFASTFEDKDDDMDTSSGATSSNQPLPTTSSTSPSTSVGLGAALKSTSLTDEVVISGKGSKFHFMTTCPGLQKATTVLSVIDLQEAKKTHTLCDHCSLNGNFRTPVCCTPNCNLRPTFMQ